MKVKRIVVMSNASVRVVYEDDTSENIDILKPLIMQLNKENLITENTIVSSVFNTEVKVIDWYDIKQEKILEKI